MHIKLLFIAHLGVTIGFKIQDSEVIAKADPKQWKAYRGERGDHDCNIQELNNWYGAQRCIENFECQGARLCERGSKNLGWCSGDSACPNLGPLDYHDWVSLISLLLIYNFRKETQFGIQEKKEHMTKIGFINLNET